MGKGVSMIIEDKFTMKAPIQDIWEFFLEPNTLAVCIPGAEEVKVIDEKNYDCVVNQKVGPINLKLKFKFTIIEMKHPMYIKVIGYGLDLLKSGGFKIEIIINLIESANGVEIKYLTQVYPAGKFANFGERIIRAKAKQMNQDLKNNLETRFKERLSQRG